MITTSTHHLLLLSSFLAVSLTCISGAAAPPPPVYDKDGHELSSGERYFVLPAVRGGGGGGGGLTMAPHGSPCPLYVAQEARERRRGLPVRFTPVQQQASASPATVRVSSDLGVQFDAVTTCVQSTEWHVEGRDPRPGHGLVATGPIRGTTGREKVFRIEKVGHGYKLVSCRDKCQDLGLTRDETGRLWFGASDRAHEVVFQKAPTV